MFDIENKQCLSHQSPSLGDSDTLKRLCSESAANVFLHIFNHILIKTNIYNDNQCIKVHIGILIIENLL